MKLIPKEYENYNPIQTLLGALFVVVGGYGLLIMGIRGPAIVWLLRGIPAIFLAVGSIIVIKQLQARRRS
jgi:hypothetical protein